MSDFIAAFDFVSVQIGRADIVPEKNGFKATFHLAVSLNPNVTTAKRDGTPYEERSESDSVFLSIIGALLVDQDGKQWITEKLPSAFSQNMIWGDEPSKVRVCFHSDSSTKWLDGTRVTFDINVHDIKAAEQQLTFVFENQNWRRTEKTAKEMLEEHRTKPVRRSKQ